MVDEVRTKNPRAHGRRSKTQPGPGREGSACPVHDVLIGGACMSPLFEVGDVIRVEPVDAAGVRRGDVVVIGTEARHLAHRVVLSWPWFGGRRVAHRGDVAGSRLSVGSAASLRGRVRWVRRLGETAWHRVESRPFRPLLSDVVELVSHYCASLRQRG